MANNGKFQDVPDAIVWKVHFLSPPGKVYEALSTDAGRKTYWAESADETDGRIHYVFLNGVEDTGEILEREPGRVFKATYFDWTVTFDLRPDAAGGTDMQVT